MSRLLHFFDKLLTDDREVVELKRQPRFTVGRYSFLLEAESTPGP
jgi:hypothetical protein